MPPADVQARPFLTALRDRWWIVALCTLAAGFLAYATVKQQPGQYQAGALLGLKSQTVDRDIFNLSPSQMSAEQTLAEQPGQLEVGMVDDLAQAGLADRARRPLDYLDRHQSSPFP